MQTWAPLSDSTHKHCHPDSAPSISFNRSISFLLSNSADSNLLCIQPKLIMSKVQPLCSTAAQGREFWLTILIYDQRWIISKQLKNLQSGSHTQRRVKLNNLEHKQGRQRQELEEQKTRLSGERQDLAGKDYSQLDLLPGLLLRLTASLLLLLLDTFLIFHPNFLLNFSPSLVAQGQRDRKNRGDRTKTTDFIWKAKKSRRGGTQAVLE